MTKEPLIINEKTLAIEALNIMDGKKSNRIVWSLPIIHSQEGKLVGLIRHHQLINAGLKEVQN